MNTTCRVAATTCALVVAGFAQNVPAPATGAAGGAPQQDPVQLSAFEVVADPTRGYITTSSLSASRIAVPITDLPASLIVINEKLIEDTVAISIGETFNLISGVNKGNQGTGTQDQNTLAMRGYEMSNSQRDGVADRLITASGGFDYSYIDRIEVIKGPSGVLYGTHSSGGVINFVSKRPLLTPRTRVSAMVGSWDTWRAELDTSGFFDKGRKLGYRLAVALVNTDGVMDFAGDPDEGLKSYNPSLSYQFENGLRIWLWGAFVRDNMNRLAYTAHAYRTGPNTGQVLFREAELSGNNIFVNLTEVNSDNYEMGLSHGLKLGPVQADLRLLGRWYELQSDGSRIRGIGPGTDLFLDAQGNVIGSDSRFTDYADVSRSLARVARRQVRYDYRPSQTDGDEYAADLNLKFELGATRHNLLLYGTYGTSDDASDNNAYDITDNARLLALGFETIPNGFVLSTTRPDPSFRPDPQSIIDNANVVNLRDTVVRDDIIYGVGAIERLSFLEDRAVLVGGIRSSTIDTTTAQIVFNQLSDANTTKDRTNTSSLAALYKVYSGDHGTASLFYNKNETFSPVFAIDRRLATFGQRFPNRVTETDEFGIKADLWKGRVALTAAVFDTTQNNGLQSFPDEDGSITGSPISTYQAPTGLRTTKGWEIDLNVRPLPGVDMLLSYGDVEAETENGGRVEAVPDKTFAMLGRYEFERGAMKGASVTWIYNYWGRSMLGSRTNWELPSGSLHTLVLGYTFRERVTLLPGRWSARLRIENIFDKPSALPATFETAVGVTKPLNYRVGISYEF